ncbi:hypothetical protein HAX54_026053, partial [Datura stramonium]|nr:hypothetical protein [Datura stramonium]
SIIVQYSNCSDSILTDISKKMKIKFDKYWGDVEGIDVLLFVVVVLDPRYKINENIGNKISVISQIDVLDNSDVWQSQWEKFLEDENNQWLQSTSKECKLEDLLEEIQKLEIVEK